VINFFSTYIDGEVYQLPEKGSVHERTGLLKAAGMAFMKTGADIAGAATIAAGGVVGMFEDGAYERGAADRVFKFYDDYVKPARDYWTPDPESVSTAGRLVGGITSLGTHLLLGPAAIPSLIGSAAFNTGVDLVDSGVDANTATGLSILSAGATGAMVALPAAGKTLAQTLMLIASNPITGAVQEGVSKKVLEAQGYDEQAQVFNPFDPVNRTLDLVLGGIFGGMAHYGRARAVMPVHFEDAIDTAAAAQKAAKSNPIEDTGRHTKALNKAISDLTEARPVDVSATVKNAGAVKAEQVLEPEAVQLREKVDAEVKLLEEAGRTEIEKPFVPVEDNGLKLGDFGPMFTEFKGDAPGAVKHLMEHKTGETVGALYHKDIGEIDLVWGKEGTPEKDYEDGYGLAKIAKKHPEILDEDFQALISQMTIRSKIAHRISLESPDHRAAVKLEWEGKEKRWLVTAFKKKGPSHTEGLPGVSGNEGGAPPAPQDGLKSNIAQRSKKVNKASKGKSSTLADFVRSQGGISSKDEYMKGDVRDRFSIKAGYNLVNNKTGMTLDRLAEAAWEAGYFPERPTVSEFLDALREDVDARTNKTGKAVFAAEDKDAQIESMLDQEYARYLDREVEQILTDNPDMTVYAGLDESGQPIMARAREYVDAARVEVERAVSMEELFNMAASCLRKG